MVVAGPLVPNEVACVSPLVFSGVFVSFDNDVRDLDRGSCGGNSVVA
jgi:hypothetical protein